MVRLRIRTSINVLVHETIKSAVYMFFDLPISFFIHHWLSKVMSSLLEY